MGFREIFRSSDLREHLAWRQSRRESVVKGDDGHGQCAG